MIYGNIRTRCGSGTILHLDVAQWGGQPNHELPTLESVRAFLSEHAEVQAVMFADSRLPRRAVPVEKLTDAMLRKLYR
jgi:hypothetical protein